MSEPLPESESADEPSGYRAVSGWALVAMAQGVLSPLALLHPVLWVLPVAGLAASLIALVRVSRQPELVVGRKAALVGLVAALVFLTAGPARWLTYRLAVRAEAREFAGRWLSLLQQDLPHAAHQLTVAPPERAAGDVPLWDFYRHNSAQRASLEQFVEERFARTMLALGRDAQARFYETRWQGSSHGVDRLLTVYAITLEDQRRPHSFFVCVQLRRYGGAAWRVLEYEGACLPPSWQERG